MMWTGTWKAATFTLQAEDRYDNPYMDVTADVSFRHECGDTFVVPCFWEGDATWRVRFAPPMAGLWTWISHCSNHEDSGLHGVTGSLEVESAMAGDSLPAGMSLPGDSAGENGNALEAHGFLKVSENGRGFVHADGTPFFWLGDTVWACPSRATQEEWEAYLDGRHRQGFNVAQVNLLPQHDASGTDYRVPFEEGPVVWNLERPNLSYFQRLDRMLAAAADRGMVTAGVVLWFDYVPGTNPAWSVYRKADFTPELAGVFGRWLAARYAAYGLVWLVSGDSDYESAYAAQVYSAAAHAILEGSPTGALMTAHLNGGLSTPKNLHDAGWLNFHMYQSSHHLDSHLTAQRYSAEDRALLPIRPVLNGEPAYENIGCYGREGTLGRDLVRKVAWYSLLSGGNAGITYGGHGLWSWHREGEAFAPGQVWGMPVDWRHAAAFPGSDDYARLKRFMEGCSWWNLEPVVSPFVTEAGREEPVCATDGNVFLAYLAGPMKISADNGTEGWAQASWFNPADGRWAEGRMHADDGHLTIEKPPFQEDAVLVVTLAQGV